MTVPQKAGGRAATASAELAKSSLHAESEQLLRPIERPGNSLLPGGIGQHRRDPSGTILARQADFDPVCAHRTKAHLGHIHGENNAAEHYLSTIFHRPMRKHPGDSHPLIDDTSHTNPGKQFATLMLDYDIRMSRGG
ncbi:hypothetical protein [Nocardia barduliensis]|uniref:hypothetical protein n=1 Tax=Nocardia barduliensis TaxID=2736643 RepID=UPI0015745B11|nr:hypothetical protein [Nocardia barduliensis]